MVRTPVLVLLLASTFVTADPIPLYPARMTHEETAVRKTYANLTHLCLSPDNPPPVFKIENVRTGTIASIATQKWATLFTFPDDGVVLAGHWKQTDFNGQSHGAMSVQWGTDDSYTPERLAQMKSITISKAVNIASKELTTPATYTRYATFQVIVAYQGREVGPYRATFFFGKDANGNEVIAPQDAIVSGQLLWYAVRDVH